MFIGTRKRDAFLADTIEEWKGIVKFQGIISNESVAQLILYSHQPTHTPLYQLIMLCQEDVA